MAIKVSCEVQIEEIDGNDVTIEARPGAVLRVCSHGASGYVTLEVGSRAFTVRRAELIAAVENATNTAQSA